MSILKKIKINSTTAREFIFFLLLTTLVAGLIKLSKTYTTNYELALDIVDLPLEKSIRYISPEVINVNASHTGFAMLRNSVSGSEIKVSFSSMKKTGDGAYTYVVNDHVEDLRNALHGNIDVTSTKPTEIIVVVDSMASKRVEITADVDVNYAPGYGATEKLLISPDSVTIVGPSALLKTINEVQTQKYSVEDVSSSIHEELILEKPDSTEILKYSISKVVIDQDVNRFTEGTVTVPIQVINNVGGKLKILPKTVQIIYTVQLDDFDEVSSSDFLVSCVYDKKSTTDNYLPLTISRMPKNISSVRLVDKQVQFILID
ncbi:hypothetical protein [Dokdonia sp. Hel_I_53]|uniref:hypothetical protein n=1 Tax=Dokdonia sp. Hel_I_53 TaxID=1566287 RepID=UPI00119B7FC6|nr:hypothetical protein [Dokdonia sp. Hel_I_53]TVZ53273.1 hypothetical protein OD90_2473 [Dokdonia sp. Hel_I_53]